MARLRASFELNWTWGDTSYSTGGNFGGALSGRLGQPRDAERRGRDRSAAPLAREHRPAAPVGQHPRSLPHLLLDDGALAASGSRSGAPTRSASAPTARRSGSSSASARTTSTTTRCRSDDHVLLFEALTDRDIRDGWHVGASVRYLRDTSSGAGGVSVLGQGPDSTLADYNGVFRFPLNGQKYHANLAWVGRRQLVQPRVHRRPLRRQRVRRRQPRAGRRPAADDGQLRQGRRRARPRADARVGFRYGNTRNDIVTAEIIYSTGDANGISDGRYSGVITGNTYGAPGGVFTTSGAYLLMPHSNVVNRYYSAVPDLSNQGYGLTASTVNASYDLYRNVLTAKVGAARRLEQHRAAGRRTLHRRRRQCHARLSHSRLSFGRAACRLPAPRRLLRQPARAGGVADLGSPPPPAPAPAARAIPGRRSSQSNG